MDAENRAVAEHCAEIGRCNQRGGRMLSIVDLVEAGTVPPDVAAFLFERVSAGESFVVGARPGGAGKTTVMGALLNLIPPGRRILHAEGPSALAAAAAAEQPACVVCHEIGAGPYYAYLWGRDAAAFFRLGRLGHSLATNLHADTLDEAREILCGENPVESEDFSRVGLWLFLAVGRGGARRLSALWTRGGDGPRRVFAEGRFTPPPGADAGRVAACGTVLAGLLERGVRRIEDVRAEVLGGFPFG